MGLMGHIIILYVNFYPDIRNSKSTGGAYLYEKKVNIFALSSNVSDINEGQNPSKQQYMF